MLKDPLVVNITSKHGILRVPIMKTKVIEALPKNNEPSGLQLLALDDGSVLITREF